MGGSSYGGRNLLRRRRAGLEVLQAQEEGRVRAQFSKVWSEGWAAGSVRYRFELGEAAPRNPYADTSTNDTVKRLIEEGKEWGRLLRRKIRKMERLTASDLATRVR